MSVVVRRREERLSSAFRNKGNGRWEGGLSRTSVGKVKVKSKKSSNSLLFPVTKKKSCFNFQSPLSGPTDFNFSILPIPDVFGLKATAFSAAGKERSVVTLAHCPVRAASACSGSSPLPRRHAGALSVCGGRSSETDPFEVDTVVGVGVSAALVGQPCAAERSATAPWSKCGRRCSEFWIDRWRTWGD